MRILIVNKFYYPRGGDCIVAMATAGLLRENGHSVRIFAMKYPENISVPESSSFADEVKFDGNIRDKRNAVKRLFGIDSIKDRFEKVISDFKPDVVHFHNIHSYLSPVIVEIAARHGIRTVWTMHDYKLICPSYNCRLQNGENCEECIHNPKSILLNRCMKGSLAQSVIAYFEARIWNRSRLQNVTDLFIAPSRFLKNKMLEAGFSHKKLISISNFIDPDKLKIITETGTLPPEDYFCYVGRLSDEKGISTLLAAATSASVRLKIAGDGPLLNSLKKQYGVYPNIEFLGKLSARKVTSLLAHAKASVIPSEWYENNPLSVIESLCCGTPVIGANIGGIPELINEKNGIVFTSGNGEELTGILRTFDQRNKFDRKKISSDAINRFCKETHYKALMQAYAFCPDKELK